MPISTYGITLKWGESASPLTKKIDVKDFPDLGGAPELIETTTLSDKIQKFIPGVKSVSAMEFTANYTKSDYEAVKADEGKDLYYSLSLGENGSEGVFTWQGRHSVWVPGAGVNSPVEMKMSVAPSTEPVLNE